MSKLNWRTVSQAELSLLLQQASLDASQAVGTTSTVYQLTVAGRAMLAIALPDGQAVLVEAAAPVKINRRKSPASPAYENPL